MEPPNDARAWEEYKLLQEKIDRIGDFRFRIKGWGATLFLGFALGGYASKVPWYAYIPLLVLLFSFWLLEERQGSWESAFKGRLVQLEKGLRRNTLKRLGRNAPRNTIAPGIGQAIGRHLTKLRTPRGAIVKYADPTFYFLTGLITIGLMCLSPTAPEPAPVPSTTVLCECPEPPPGPPASVVCECPRASDPSDDGGK